MLRQLLVAFLLVGSGSLFACAEECPKDYQSPTKNGVPAMSAEESANHLLEHPAPKYPFRARVKHTQGKVVLSGTIRKDGTVGDLKAVCGDERLAKSALKAVTRWRYRPFEWQGKIVDVPAFVVVNFELEN